MTSMKKIIENFNNFVEGVDEDININEGGLKAPHLTGDVKLDPKTVAAAVKVYELVMSMWNKYLVSKGQQPIELVGPVGSTAYYARDEPTAEYGDVDFLISIPVEFGDDSGHNDIRKAENKTQREYEKLLKDFLTTTTGMEKLVHVESTVASSPYLLIVRLLNGDYVQVDTIITHPKYSAKDSQWMPGRWTPEHGIKGYTLGNLYTALGSHFNMSIGDRGVAARMIDGERVSSRKTSADLVTISTNIRTFLRDMAKEIGGEGIVENELLTKYPGVDPENVKISSLALGIKGLALTLVDNGVIESSNKMLDDILSRYLAGLTKNVESKKKRGASNEIYDKLIKLNDRVYHIVDQAFGEERNV